MPSRLRAISSMMAKARASDCTPPRGWIRAAALAGLCLLCTFIVASPPALLFRRHRVGQIALAEDRLLVRCRRQLPGSRRRRTHFRVHMHVEQKWFVGLDGVLERAFEVL